MTLFEYTQQIADSSNVVDNLDNNAVKENAEKQSGASDIVGSPDIYEECVIPKKSYSMESVKSVVDVDDSLPYTSPVLSSKVKIKIFTPSQTEACIVRKTSSNEVSSCL